MDPALALERLREKLLDLTLKNKLLNFRLGSSSIEIVDEVPRQVYEFLVERTRSMILEPFPEEESENPPEDSSADSASNSDESSREEVTLPKEKTESPKHNDNRLQTNLTPDLFDRRLRRILTDFREANESSGVNLLHLAIGFLEWNEEPEGRLVQAPLILIPVSLERKRTKIGTAESGRGIYRFTYSVHYDGEDLSPNISLASKLRQEFGIDLPGFDSEDENAEADFDVESYLDLVQESIADHPQTSGWSIQRRMVFGFFSFAKHRMHLDLDPELWPGGTSPLHSHLVQDVLLGREPTLTQLPSEKEVEECQSQNALPIVLDADSTQYSSLLHSMRGNNLVIEGPPGTGKSQTITNLIACALDQGKRVLFLSEKLAALQVVRRKLDDVSLGEFCLELHSHKAKMPLLLEDLRNRLDIRLEDTQKTDPQKRLNKKRDTLTSYIDIIREEIGPFEDTVEEVLWNAHDYAQRVRVLLPEEQVLESYPLNGPLAESPTRLDMEKARDALAHASQHLKEEILENARSWKGFEAQTILPNDREHFEAGLKKSLELTEEIQNEVETFLRDHQLADQPELQAIENLKKIHSGNYLPPATWNPGLADQVWSTPEDQQAFDAFVDQLDQFDSTLAKAHWIKTPYAWNRSQIDHLRELLKLVSQQGFKLFRIEDLYFTLQEIEGIIQPLVAHLKLSTEDRNPLSITGDELAVERLKNEFQVQRHLQLFPGTSPHQLKTSFLDSVTQALLSQALEQKSKLLDERQFLEEHFSLRDAPKGDELISLRTTLRAARGQFFSWWPWGKAAEARKQLHSFTKSSQAAKDERIFEKLERLELFQERLSTFENEDTFSHSFGDHFKGLETDWEYLKVAIPWAQKLIELTDEETARSLIENLNSHLDQLRAIEEKSASIESLSNSLAKIEALFWATEEGSCPHLNEQQSLEDWVTHLDKIQKALSSLTDCIEIDDDLRAEAYEEFDRVLTVLWEAQSVRESLEKSKFFPLAFDTEFKDYPKRRDGLAILQGWAQRLFSLGLPWSWQSWMVRVEPQKRIEAITEILPRFKAKIEALEESFIPLRKFGSAEAPCPFTERWLDRDILTVRSGLEACLHSMGQLLPWANYCRARRSVIESGALSVLEAGERKELPPEALSDALYHSLYDGMGRELLQTKDALATFDRVRHERTRKEFQSTDQASLEWNRGKIAEGLVQNEAPTGISKGRVRDWTELSLIKRECDKKRRHIPIRQLVKRAGQALQSLKPCWMMSPLSIAQFLPPGEIEFDLVVMDEASQIRPEDGLGALARTQQLVVVGDTRQMPPTSFFSRASEELEDDDEDLTSAEEVESILEAASKVYPPCMLRWHYRSEHHSLIEFSNNSYYDEKLVVFPSRHRRHPNLGVKWHPIPDGQFYRQKNIEEAKAVVEAIIVHAKETVSLSEEDRESLGIATMNIHQRDLILDLLDEKAGEDDETRLALTCLEEMSEPLFVKNLENVQGDERDAILISCTYGPVPDNDKVPQRFGPLNQAGGHRRLNVLFTRARKRTEVFSSLRPDQIEGGDEKARGVNDFKQYLEFAQSQAIETEPTGVDSSSKNAFQTSIERAVEDAGYPVLTRYGIAGTYIDMVILNPDDQTECLLGVESDGSNYHRILCSRDRDRLKEEVLTRRGWNIHRVWSTDWFTRGEEEKKRLLRALKKAKKQN